VLPILPVLTLRRLFAILVGIIGIEMIVNGIRGRI
jgi:small neutral amino acid transporter SnatA (MarC family)